jgi:hypothetical protein
MVEKNEKLSHLDVASRLLAAPASLAAETEAEARQHPF